MTMESKSLVGRARPGRVAYSWRLAAMIVAGARRLVDLRRRRRDLPDALRRDVGLPPHQVQRDWRDYS